MSAGPNGWKHVRCARENETAPVRQKLPGSVLFFLNYKPEYVPNTLCKPGIYATFSGKKFSPFGRTVLENHSTTITVCNTGNTRKVFVCLGNGYDHFGIQLYKERLPLQLLYPVAVEYQHISII